MIEWCDYPAVVGENIPVWLVINLSSDESIYTVFSKKENALGFIYDHLGEGYTYHEYPHNIHGKFTRFRQSNHAMDLIQLDIWETTDGIMEPA